MTDVGLIQLFLSLDWGWRLCVKGCGWWKGTSSSSQRPEKEPRLQPKPLLRRRCRGPRLPPHDPGRRRDGEHGSDSEFAQLPQRCRGQINVDQPPLPPAAGFFSFIPVGVAIMIKKCPNKRGRTVAKRIASEQL